ncbi:CoA transferase [Candidatus Binatia bacterium]|jgi:crotonobetainyl-CoA:carnitine CoA-transferase CaiB-like acyl-CoA transferase|nr:CoA transferase [Candidatus Binatia bacterium]
MQRPLDGFRVLDLSDETGFLCGRMLAELGADVVKVEPPSGDPARFRPPYVGGIADPERAVTWLAYNASKRGVTLDLAAAEGRALFDRLCATADAIVETYDPATLAVLKLDWAMLHAAHPQLVVCSITPFGRTGPYAAFRGSDVTVTAMGGNMALTGDPDRAPLRCTMPSSYYHGGAEAASGLLVALLARGVIGEGQHVDVSLQAAMVSTIMTGASQWAMDRRDRGRTGASYPVGKTLQREVWRCKDGFVSYALRGGPARVPGLQATERWLAEEKIAAPAWQGRDWKAYNHNDLTQDQVDALSAPLQELFLRKPMRELFDESVRRGVMLAPVNDSREIANGAQLRSREFFVEVDDAKRGLRYELPARFAQMSRYGTDVRGAAPLLGEHNAEVYGAIGVSAAEVDELRRAGVI